MMNSFNEKLENILKTNDAFVDKNRNTLLKNEIIIKAYHLDRKLISLLLQDEDVKKKFFSEIEGHWVFNILAFEKYITDKKFLNDSYTEFSNKIGLTIDGKTLRERGEVVLSFPFKDCILEGGQNEDEEARKEIFFNEILAQDEITHLLDPKVLTNAKRVTAQGEQPLTAFNRNDNGRITDNLLIKGNNLLALHSLKQEFAGRVKLIYIDPPYNTGNDSFKYNDTFNHSTWLTFMKNRLQVARQLLSDDGVIFVQCDDNEQAYLKVLMDEVFGRENFVNNLSVKMSSSAGLKMANKNKKLLKIKESILIHAKNSKIFELSSLEDLYVDKKFYEKARSDKYIINFEEPHESWEFLSVHEAHEQYAKPTETKLDFVNRNAFRIFNHVINDSTKKHWQKLSQNDKEKYTNKVRSYNVKGSDYEFAYNDHVFIPYNSKYLEGDIWEQNFSIGGTKTQEGGVHFTQGRKKENLLKRIILISTQQGDIVLDFFAGSGTTAAVAHKMGRQYITIEQMDYIETITKARIEKVIAGEQGGISNNVNWQGGGEFIYLELKAYNEEFINRIQDAKNSTMLLTIWNEMKEKSFINYNVDFRKADLAFEEWQKLDFADQQKALIALLDKNYLYVNLSAIDDADFKCSDEEKKLSRNFYQQQ